MGLFPESIDDLMRDPNRYGMPTLEQFTKNKEKYVGARDEALASIDAGDLNTGAIQRYYMETDAGVTRLDSLEQAQRIAMDMGFDLLQDFVADPQYRPRSTPTRSGKMYDLEVTFRLKDSVRKRSEW